MFLAGAIGILALGVVSRLSLARARDIPGWQDRGIRAKIVEDAAGKAGQLSPGKPLFLVYGEPALFFDLAIETYNPQPPLGGDFSFLGPGQKPLPQPAFLLAFEGTADFDKLIEPYKKSLELETVFHAPPSDLVLLDTYSPARFGPRQATAPRSAEPLPDQTPLMPV